MTANNSTRTIGWRVYALGVMLLAMLGLAWGVFDQGQPVPTDFPGYTALAYLAATLMLLAGAAIQWRRTAAWGAAVLACYYAVVVVILMNGPIVLAQPAEYLPYEGAAVQLAIAAGALLVFAGHARIDAALCARLVRTGQVLFGVCALVFGGAHFAYLTLTAPLVPHWLPPSQAFWAYATGIFQIAAGLALLAKVLARLAAVLLTGMYASFTLLVHLPLLLGDPSRHFFWSENAANVALIGVAWVVAESLPRAKRPWRASLTGTATVD